MSIKIAKKILNATKIIDELDNRSNELKQEIASLCKQLEKQILEDERYKNNIRDIPLPRPLLGNFTRFTM